MKSEQKRVIIIGAGRLGTALGIALDKKKYDVLAFVSRDIRHAKKSAKLVNTKTISLASGNLSSLPPSDIIFITTPDDAIEQVAEQLSASLLKTNSPKYVFHTSGALSSSTLLELKKHKIAIGSLHPLISVSNSVIGARNLCKAYYCIEGEKKAVSVAKKIVKDLGGQSFSIKTEDKVLYHAAAVIASGHFTALFDIAVEMLMKCGLDSKEARESLLPLVQSTVENLFVNEPSKALTGTFARADISTTEKHLAAIKSSKLEEAFKAYILLGFRSLELARQNGKDKRALNEIKKLLSQSDR